MFGQQNKPFSFGNTGTGFGTQANTFGSTATAGFGASTPFGAQTPQSTNLFGSSTPAAGTSLFGGGTSAFGTSTANTQSTGFSFGQPATSQSTGLFGGNQQQSGGLFATPAAMGTKQASSSFGGFGQPSTGTTSLFGSTNTNAGSKLFGTGGTSTSLFGGSSAFGSTTAPTGTTIKFNPPAGNDTMLKNGISTSISTKHQCITAMKEYETKSLEELRMEDYLANRKGPSTTGTATMFGTQQNKTGTSSFGTGFTLATPATKSGFGGFGGFNSTTATPQTSVFGGQQKTSLFGGATATTTAASTGFGGFGGTSSIFGNQQAKSSFGTSTAFNTTTNTGFGGATSGFGGFNTSQASTGSTLFGGAAKPAFGTTATTASTGGTGFNFGQTNPAGTSLFGQKPASTGFGGFGATTNTGFGTQSSTLFGQNKPTGFGATTGFGNTGGFNTGATGMFGTNTLTNTSAFPATNLLGGQPNTLQQPTIGNQAAMNNMAVQQAQVQQQIVALANSPYGDSPLFRNLTQDPAKREDLKPTNPAAQKAILSQASQYKMGGIRASPKIKAKPIHSLANGKSQLFEGLDEDSTFGNDTFVPRKSVKKLVIKKSSPGNSSFSQSMFQSRTEDDLASPASVYPSTSTVTPLRPVDLNQSETPEIILGSKSVVRSSVPDERPNLDDTITALNSQNKKKTAVEAFHESSQDDSINDGDSDQSDSFPPPPHPAGIVLSRPDYYTVPSLEELAEIVDNNGDCHVENFTIGRAGYGSVYFPGVTNVANMNLDEIVHFRRKEITIYPDDGNKPAEGNGLNKKAEVTLDCVWPTDKSTRSPIKNPERLKVMSYHGKIEQSTLRIGAKFIDYRPETGSWVFEVKHFSKYGLVDDSDDEDDSSEANKKKLKLLQQQQQAIQKQKILLINGKQPPMPAKQLIQGKQLAPPVEVLQAPMLSMDDEDSDMEDIEREALPQVPSSGSGEEMEDVEDDPQTVPMSHRIAQSMGVDARHVQIMKASFFGSDDEMDEDVGLGGTRMVPQYSQPVKTPVTPASPAVKPLEKSVLNRSLLGSLLKPQYVSPRLLIEEQPRQPSPVFDLRSRGSSVQRAAMHPPPIEHPIIPSGMTRNDRPRKLVGSRVQRQQLEFSKSIMYDKQNMLMDSGLFMGRSFRVGWGPNWTLAHSGAPVCSNKTESQAEHRFSLLPGINAPIQRKQSTPYNVVLEKVKVTASGFLGESEKAACESNLAIQLEHSESLLQDGCPVFAATPGVDALHEYANQSVKQLEMSTDVTSEPMLKQSQLVWSLCVALWGRLPNDDSNELDEDSYAYQQARREAVSLWLENSSREAIKQELERAQIKGQDTLSSVFSLLTGRQIAEACVMARRARDYRLALLLSQSVGNCQPRQMLKKQLEEWCEQKADRHISPDRMKVYSLLAGTLAWQAPRHYINTCHGLDWKRAFALHLWFHCPPMAGVADGLNSYEEAFKSKSGYRQYAKSPFPPYMTESPEILEEEEDADHVTRDTCYHLLSVYSKRSHRMERILAPTTSTMNQLDYKLSWHLAQVLLALDYSHLSEYHTDSIHCNFASQLESLGLWHWSVFVLLHIQERTRRECCVRQLLERHITITQSEEESDVESFLKEKLRIPKQWIHDAKALRSKYEGKKRDEAWHLLKAGHWNKSHLIVLRHIAPDCIINESYDYLKQFLCEMAEPGHSSTISDWSIGGSVYLDYINIIEQLEKLKQGERDVYELERLQPEIMSLCSRVGNLQCHDAKTRLCQSEMAKKTANLMRTLLMLQDQVIHKGSSTCVSARLLAPHISQLPMPEDYALQELRQLTRSYMLEMTS